MKNYELLVQEAIKALDNAYIPAPNGRRYASSVLTQNGTIYSSANYFSDTLSLTLHCEQGALIHASAHGEHDIVAIASVGTEDPESKHFCSPCGMCKQLIYEKRLKYNHDIDVVMANMKGEYTVRKISELMPYPWPSK